MPWRYCGAKTIERSLNGEVIMVKSSGYRDFILPIMAREARPLVPDPRARSRFQSRELGSTSSKATWIFLGDRWRNNQPQLLLKQERAVILDRIARRQNQYLNIDLGARGAVVGCETHIIARIFGRKVVKAWNKPPHGEGAEACHVQDAVITLRYDAKRVFYLVERGSQREAEHAAFRSELRAISGTLEKLRADECLKMADMPTDRSMRHGKFLGGCGKLAMARSSFKGAQRRDGYVFATLHVSYSHNKTANMSIYSVFYL